MLERERARMEAVMRAIRSTMEMPSENREQLPMEMDIDFSGTDSLASQGILLMHFFQPFIDMRSVFWILIPDNAAFCNSIFLLVGFCCFS